LKPLTRDEILDVDSYAALRDSYRPRLIAHKRDRRLAVGDRVSLLFEDRETLRYQIQEMMRVERIRSPDKIQQEIDVYNELIPGENELSATLFIEIPELERIRPELDRLIGIDEHVCLVIGEGEDEVSVRARFDPKQMEEERISAVQYIRFALPSEQVKRFLGDARVRVRTQHPNYRNESELPSALRESLRRDLCGETPELIDAGALATKGPSQPQPLIESDRVRAYRPARPLSPEHLVVESLAEVGSLVEADPDLLAEMMEVVRRLAAAITESSGGCRVFTDVEPGGRLRWHLLELQKRSGAS
jgi:hypothetical protein